MWGRSAAQGERRTYCDTKRKQPTTPDDPNPNPTNTHAKTLPYQEPLGPGSEKYFAAAFPEKAGGKGRQKGRKKGRTEERKKGRKEERKKGEKEEREKGRKEGREKGRKEGKRMWCFYQICCLFLG